MSATCTVSWERCGADAGQKPYTPLTAGALQLLGDLTGFTAPAWTGPALPVPAGAHTADEIASIVSRMLARGQYLMQAQDALSVTYTLQGITATAERFTLGTASHVQRADALRAIYTVVQNFFARSGLGYELETRVLPELESLASTIAHWLPAPLTRPDPVQPDESGADYSAFALEDMRQFAMGWTALEDVFRRAYPRLGEFVRAATDAQAATDQFWPILSGTALPFNLLVLQRLTAGNAEPFRTRFGPAWTAEIAALLGQGRLYGIDMTIFAGLAPQDLPNGTTRSTPSTMALLAMGDDGAPRPIATYVADPQNGTNAQVYGPSSPAWIYSLLAVKTSLAVHGIWLGHVYTLHIVTAAMQMALWDTLPPDHILFQMLAPQSRFTIAFDFLLLAGWSRLSPPTSISDPSKFLTLCGKYAATHDFFSTDPPVMLASLGLDEPTFTAPGQPPWSRYPNVARTMRLWDLTAAYVQGVIDAGYASDTDVAQDPHLAAWIAAASAPDGGNITGLPQIRTKAALVQLVTSYVFRIAFHGMGRLRSMGNPEPSFAPNMPPTLQSTRIPSADEQVSTGDLLREFLPRTGTIGELLTFYDIFSFNAPYQPLVPSTGPETASPFDARYPGATNALIAFRRGIEQIVRDLEPDWVQIGQWPLNIEL